ncbi:hypothetical protein MTYM_01974 [Methylococcales bacterium]|nr:hypothetical protein MTYM_01974 [Methylococcales bacterium]
MKAWDKTIHDLLIPARTDLVLGLNVPRVHFKSSTTDIILLVRDILANFKVLIF